MEPQLLPQVVLRHGRHGGAGGARRGRPAGGGRSPRLGAALTAPSPPRAPFTFGAKTPPPPYWMEAPGAEVTARRFRFRGERASSPRPSTKMAAAAPVGRCLRGGERRLPAPGHRVLPRAPSSCSQKPICVTPGRL